MDTFDLQKESNSPIKSAIAFDFDCIWSLLDEVQ